MRSVLVIGLVVLCGCSLPGRNLPLAQSPGIAVDEAPGPEVVRPQGRPDAAAPLSVAPAGQIGETLAGLGAAGEAGLWLRTGLVDGVRRGRVVAPSGQTLAVELRPSGAEATAGSHLSLSAMRDLGVPLGTLVLLRVYAD